MRGTWFLRVVAAAVTAVAVLTGCGSGPDITYGGQEVANGDKFLVSLEKTFRDDAASGETPAKLHAHARCYLAASSPKGEIKETAYCGPVLHQFGEKGKAYDAYPVAVTGSDDEPILEVAGEPTAGVAVPDDVILVRPDGETPPRDLGDLAPPPPPALESGAVMALETETGDPLTDVADGRLFGYSVRFQERGFAVLDTVGRGTEQRRAADGEELLLVRYDYSASTSYGDPATATLLVDGARTTIDDLIGTGEGQLLVVSVPADAESVALEIAQEGVDQLVDLRSGERVGDFPAVLYREGPSVRVEDSATWVSAPVNQTFSLPFMAEGFGYETRLTVQRMDLWYWSDSGKRASSPDRALLQFIAQSDGGFVRGAVDPARVVLVADDGTNYTATSDNQTDNIDLINNRYWFEVPATFTGGTITITPGVVPRTYESFSGGTPMDYKDAKVQFAITLQ